MKSYRVTPAGIGAGGFTMQRSGRAVDRAIRAVLQKIFMAPIPARTPEKCGIVFECHPVESRLS